MNQYREGKVKSTPTRGVKQYLKPNAYNQSELDWTLITICAKPSLYNEDTEMADGLFAILTFAIGLTDMSVNYCGTDAGCLGRSEATPRLSVSVGEFDDPKTTSNQEIYIRYEPRFRNGPFGHAVGLSLAEAGEVWIGVGPTYIWQPDRSPVYAELHAMTGLYDANGGLDLGGPIQFRSGIEFGYENDAGWRYALSYDHRSNADIYSSNTGVETYMVRVSVPLR